MIGPTDFQSLIYDIRKSKPNLSEPSLYREKLESTQVFLTTRTSIYCFLVLGGGVLSASVLCSTTEPVAQLKGKTHLYFCNLRMHILVLV
jgi:hypothetical protein